MCVPRCVSAIRIMQRGRRIRCGAAWAPVVAMSDAPADTFHIVSCRARALKLLRAMRAQLPPQNRIGRRRLGSRHHGDLERRQRGQRRLSPPPQGQNHERGGQAHR